jgi:hypothetical protein
MITVPAQHPSTQTISLVATDGRVLATAQAAPRSVISRDNPDATMPGQLTPTQTTVELPFVSTSADRVYYLDGNTQIRYLATDGSSGLAGTVAGSSTTQAVFAVSADNRRIAVALLDFSSNPAQVHLYVEDLGGGHHVDLKNPASFAWPVGWQDGRVVLEVVASPLLDYGFYTPITSPQWFAVMDANTGSLVTRVGTSCKPSPSLPSNFGIVCSTGQITAVDWNGQTKTFAGSMTGAGGSLSPDGTKVAICCESGSVIDIIEAPSSGGSDTRMSANGYPEDGGWLDNTHVVYRGAGSSSQQILDTTSGASTPIAVDGVMVARIPAGF